MKILPAGLQDFLDGGETTMVHCWKVTRTDGRIQGFTEHDNDLTFNGLTYIANSGFTATKIQFSLGLSVDNLNADGAISSDTINETDLASGKYDDAIVELFWVNFENLTHFILLSKGNLGQVKRGELAFSAEFRSQAAKLQQRTGRVYQRTCDTILGKSRCGVDLSSYTSTGAVSLILNNRQMHVTGLSNDTDGYYSLGLLTFKSGLNDTLKFEVKAHSTGSLMLWEKPPFAIGVGDLISVVAGCDKFPETCQSKFNNIINFQGFPFIPGNDRISIYAVRDSTQTGESIFND
jgi:uncharacterized phage protein (TIGR02218 family)